MITEQDLQEAIAECEGQKNPNANTCIKLAAFYTIKQHMFPDEGPMYSFAAPEQARSEIVQYDSGSEFSNLVNDMDVNDVMAVVDDLMDTLSVLNPKLYASVLRKLEQLSLNYTHKA